MNSTIIQLRGKNSWMSKSIFLFLIVFLGTNTVSAQTIEPTSEPATQPQSDNTPTVINTGTSPRPYDWCNDNGCGYNETYITHPVSAPATVQFQNTNTQSPQNNQPSSQQSNDQPSSSSNPQNAGVQGTNTQTVSTPLPTKPVFSGKAYYKYSPTPKPTIKPSAIPTPKPHVKQQKKNKSAFSNFWTWLLSFFNRKGNQAK